MLDRLRLQQLLKVVSAGMVVHVESVTFTDENKWDDFLITRVHFNQTNIPDKPKKNTLLLKTADGSQLIIKAIDDEVTFELHALTFDVDTSPAKEQTCMWDPEKISSVYIDDKHIFIAKKFVYGS